MLRSLWEFLSTMFHRIREAVSRRLGLEASPTPSGAPHSLTPPPAAGPVDTVPAGATRPDLDPLPSVNRAIDATPGIDHRNGLGESRNADTDSLSLESPFTVMTATRMSDGPEPVHPVVSILSSELPSPSPPPGVGATRPIPTPLTDLSPRGERGLDMRPHDPLPDPEDFLKSTGEPDPTDAGPPTHKRNPDPAKGLPTDHDHILSPEEEEALAGFLGGLDAKADLTSRAKESLEETLAGLKLTREEENALADEIRQLRDLAVKLDENVVEIAAFGLVSRGKSSVLNALLGREAFKTGSTHGTTTIKTAQPWQSVTLSDGDDPDSARLVLVDTPGIDEVGGEAREALARDVARHADLLLFVVSSDMQRREYDALAQLREAQKPIILVFNQIDRYPDADRDQVYETIRDERVRHLVRPDDVVMTAARPDPYKVKIRNPDGTTTVTWERPDPVIEPLKARILEVLHREGKALVALNTLLFAGDLHHEIVSHKMHIRDDAANRLIWNFCLAKGAAVGLNPIPVADMAGGLAVDVGMIVALSRAYGIALTRRTAVILVKDMVKALGALGVVEVASRLVVAGIKSTLAGLSVATGGLALFGYGAVGLAQGVTAAYTSYILGQGAKVYLQQGCQWGAKGIKTVIQQILDQAKADSVMDRLRDDLKKKVQR